MAAVEPVARELRDRVVQLLAHLLPDPGRHAAAHELLALLRHLGRVLLAHRGRRMSASESVKPASSRAAIITCSW